MSDTYCPKLLMRDSFCVIDAGATCCCLQWGNVDMALAGRPSVAAAAAGSAPRPAAASSAKVRRGRPFSAPRARDTVHWLSAAAPMNTTRPGPGPRATATAAAAAAAIPWASAAGRGPGASPSGNQAGWPRGPGRGAAAAAAAPAADGKSGTRLDETWSVPEAPGPSAAAAAAAAAAYGGGGAEAADGLALLLSASPTDAGWSPRGPAGPGGESDIAPDSDSDDRRIHDYCVGGGRHRAGPGRVVDSVADEVQYTISQHRPSRMRAAAAAAAAPAAAARGPPGPGATLSLEVRDRSGPAASNGAAAAAAASPPPSAASSSLYREFLEDVFGALVSDMALPDGSHAARRPMVYTESESHSGVSAAAAPAAARCVVNSHCCVIVAKFLEFCNCLLQQAAAATLKLPCSVVHKRRAARCGVAQQQLDLSIGRPGSGGPDSRRWRPLAPLGTWTSAVRALPNAGRPVGAALGIEPQTMPARPRAGQGSCCASMHPLR